MTAMQAGKVYRYFRTDADHDVSADTLELSLDRGATWDSTDVIFITPEDWTPRVAAVHEANPPDAGLTGYWWRALTGPGTSRPLPIGTVQIRGRLTDSPETPHFQWEITISSTE